MRHFLLLLLCFALGPGACAYPQRSTALSPVREGGAFGDAPENLWQLTIRSAIVPPRQRSGLGWDGDDGSPDPFVQVYRDDVLVFETRIVTDSLAPEWNQAAERNVLFPAGAQIRFEMWDDDAGNPDPIGIWRGRGLPASALPDADARVVMDGTAELTFRVSSPRAHRGVGIASYEVHSGHLEVKEVEPHSPAGRAGIRADDRIVRIGSRTIEEMGEATAATALSMASERAQPVTIERGSGSEEVRFDQGFIWLSQ